MKTTQTKVKQILMLLATAFALLGAMNVQATAFIGSVTGDWSDTATWGGSGPPGASDTVTINPNITVTVSDARSVTSVTFSKAAGNTANTLTISGTGSLTVSAAFAVSGSTGTATIDLSSGAGSLATSAGGTAIPTTIALTCGSAGSTVTYSGATVTIYNTTYANLFLACTGTSSLNGPKTVGGNLTFSGGGTYSGITTGTLVVGGNLTVGGTVIVNKNGGNDNLWAVTGNLTVNGGTFNIAGNAAGLAVGGTATLSSGSIVFGNSAVGPITGDFSMSGGTLNTATSPIEFKGNFSLTGGTLTTGSGLLLFSGTGKSISANAPISMSKANITGTISIPSGTTVSFPGSSASGLTITSPGVLDNLGTVTASYASAAALAGSGQFINDTNATLNLATGVAPSISTLTITAANNTVNYTTSGKTTLALTYVNLGLTGGSGMSAAGSTVTGNLTVSGSTAVATGAWPTSPVGAVIYSSSGSSTFPAALSISSLNQSAGTLALSSGATLTVTGTGVGIWTRSAGTFTANATSTVKFTGTAPDIGGAAATAFGKLLIDSTATTATASGTAFTVATALTINPSGQLDISALSGSSVTLGASASLTNSGTIKGSIVTGATGKVFAGTDGGYGTSTIALTPTTGDLNLTSGSTVNLDVNTTAAAANDHLVVGGTLTLNSTVFNLKAPSNGATIDTADYTLATAGSISGTPVLNWVTGFVPVNSTDYVLVVSGGTIKLHNTGGVPAGSPTILATSSGGTLTLSWDSTTFPGYSVQAQTNSAGAGLGSSWSDTGSGTVSPYTPTIDQANPTVFYRLAHP